MTARLHPMTADLLNYTEPDQTGLRMVLAPDLLPAWVSREVVKRALDNVDALLVDRSVSTADLKGELNRASHRTWGGEYGRTFTPREFLEEYRAALEGFLHGR